MQTQTSESIADQIRQCNDAFEAAFARQDSAAIASLYTGEASLLPPGTTPQKGHSAIANFWQGAMQMGVAKVTLTTDEAEDLGDTAIEVGRFALYSATDDLLDQGKYLVIWKRQNENGFCTRIFGIPVSRRGRYSIVLSIVPCEPCQIKRTE